MVDCLVVLLDGRVKMECKVPGGKIRQMCECNSFNCRLFTDVPIEEAKEIKHQRWVIIVFGCRHGPDPTDTRVAERRGYTIYREGK